MMREIGAVIYLLTSVLPCFWSQPLGPYGLGSKALIPDISAYPSQDNGDSDDYAPKLYPANQYQPPGYYPQPQPQYPNDYQPSPYQYPKAYQPSPYQPDPYAAAGIVPVPAKKLRPKFDFYGLIDRLQKGYSYKDHSYPAAQVSHHDGRGKRQACHPNKNPRCSGYLLVCKCRTCPAHYPCYYHCC